MAEPNELIGEGQLSEYYIVKGWPGQEELVEQRVAEVASEQGSDNTQISRYACDGQYVIGRVYPPTVES